MTAHCKDKPTPFGLDSPQHQTHQVFPSSAACPPYAVSDMQLVVLTFPALLPPFTHSVIHVFLPRSDLLSAAVLASLLHCACGAPVTDALTDGLGGDTSGEDEVTSADMLSALDFWDLIHYAAGQHQSVVSV